MSMKSWSVRGYGVTEEDVNGASVSSKINFIKRHLPKIYEDMMKEGEENPNIAMDDTSDYLDFCDSWIDEYENECGDTGFGVIFAEAICEAEEGFNVSYHNSEYDETVIMYEERLPWEMSERVKSMTAEDMKNVFQKYLDELKVKAEIGYQEVEYYG